MKMKISPVGISLVLLVVMVYFETVPTALAGPDITPPTLTSVTISSTGAGGVWARAGDTVTLSFTSDENIMTPVVTIGGRPAIEAGAGTAWTATRVLDGTETEGTNVFTIDFTDLAGNPGTTVTAITMGGSVTIDETAPTITSREITAGNIATIVYDEQVISANGDYTNLIVDLLARGSVHGGSGTTTITLTFDMGSAPVDATGSVDIGVGVTDLAGNPFAASGFILDDGQAPSLTSVSIMSSNTNPGSWAKAGDLVTLTFASDEALMMDPVVRIGGLGAVEAGAGTAWTATRVMSGAEPNGPLAIRIDFIDLASNAGTQVTATTDLSSVTFDDILPTVTSSEITSDLEVTIVYDEPVITVIGDYSGLIIINTPASIDSIVFLAQDTVVLTFGLVLAEADDTGRITIGAGVTDRAGNIINVPGVYSLSDGQVARESHTSIGSGSAPSFSLPSFGSSSSESSITMSPISINGKHYNFIQSGNLIPAGTIPLEDNVSEESETVEQITNVIKVGQLTQLKFVTYTNLGADHIQHAAIYTNLKGTSVNPLSDTIGIIYDKGKELEIIDRNNILSEAVIKISGEGNRVDVIVNIIFSKNMDTSDLVLKMWDENRYPLYAHIEDAWKVVGETEPEDLPLFEEPIIELDSEKTVSAIKKWGGYDSEIVSDSQLLNSIGINGDYIPKWFKKSAKWIVNEQISLEEFVEALRFVHKINA